MIPDVSNLATKEEVAAVAAQIPSIESLATTEYVNSEIARVEEEIPDVSNLATKDEVTAVAAQIPDVSNFVTEETVDEKIATEIAKVVADAPEDFDTLKEVADYISSDKTRAAEIETAISNLQSDKADSSSVYTKEQADAKFLTEHQDISGFATKQEMEAGDTSVLNNVLSKMWNKGSDCFYTKKVMNGKTALIFNESDGGGSIFETNDTKSFVGVNDGGDLSTGVHVQIYSKTKTDNKGARLNVNPSGIFYGVGTSASTDPESELAVKGDIPSIEGLATTEQLTGAVETLEEAINQVLDEKANIVDVSAAIVDVETSIETKADAESVPTKTEFEALKGQFEELKQLVYEYAPGSEQEAIADGEIADLSPDNKSVHVDEPMKSVVLPESTGTLYTVEVPLRDESTVELTSPKAATVANTSDEPVNTAFSAPEPTGSSNTKIYLSGLFEDIELTNVNIDKSSSYDAAIISGNVTITEENTNPVTVAAEFSNGCVVKNDSNCDVTLNNKSAVGSSVTVLAPGSTVTIQGGQWEEFESTVGEDTLYINSAAHLKKLIINKGNCVVNSYDVSNCVDEVVNETEYTVTPRVIEVTTKTEWNKASNTDALYEVQNDISTNIRIAPGIFGSQAKMKLNGHTVTCTDANGAFVLRGSSHYIVENGTINASGYGIWLAGPGTVELKDLHIIADSHALYIEKTGGNIYTTGNCRFEVSNDDKRYVANYLDATYTGGWTHGFHFGENTEFVDFDPAASMGEPGGPVNLLDEGYHTESYAEGVHTIYKVVKDSE